MMDGLDDSAQPHKLTDSFLKDFDRKGEFRSGSIEQKYEAPASPPDETRPLPGWKPSEVSTFDPGTVPDQSSAALVVEALALSWPIWIPMLLLALLVVGLIVSWL